MTKKYTSVHRNHKDGYSACRHIFTAANMQVSSGELYENRGQRFVALALGLGTTVYFVSDTCNDVYTAESSY